MFCTFWLPNVLLATAACNFSISQVQKVVRSRQFLTFWLANVLLATVACNLFHIPSSKSGPYLSVFWHFDLQMCFRLQPRAIFPHPAFQKWSENGVLYTFWLPNVLLATAACNFSISQVQKVVRIPSVFDILTCKCASRYSGVQFVPHPKFKKWSVPLSFLTFWLPNVLLATAACNFSTSGLPKVVREWRALHILTSKCASRYSGVQFFHIPTSKSGPRMVCFAHSNLQMCFSLQRRAIFFWLTNALLATAACNFSTSQLQKVVRSWCVLYILTSKGASRHSGVQFFISPLNRYLRTRRFTEPTFRPRRPTNHWRNTAIRDLPNISRLWIFFLPTFAQLHLLSSDSTSLLCFSSSDSAALLCFFNCPYCRKLDF